MPLVKAGIQIGTNFDSKQRKILENGPIFSATKLRQINGIKMDLPEFPGTEAVAQHAHKRNNC